MTTDYEELRKAEKTLTQLQRDRTDQSLPLLSLEERLPLEDRRQQHYYSGAYKYHWIQARSDWVCMNEACKVALPYGRYYYKYRGSRSYWDFRRFKVWDRCCKLCYFDHVLNPKTEEWKREMEGILSMETRAMERAMEKVDHSATAKRTR